MVTKSKGAGAKKKGRVKVLKLNKETVKDLTGGQKKQIKGGRAVICSRIPATCAVLM